MIPMRRSPPWSPPGLTCRYGADSASEDWSHPTAIRSGPQHEAKDTAQKTPEGCWAGNNAIWAGRKQAITLLLTIGMSTPQIVYEFLLRYVVCQDTDAKAAKKYIDQASGFASC
jgi:hypothetical protein